jgi:MSHA pilin protein MshD
MACKEVTAEKSMNTLLPFMVRQGLNQGFHQQTGVTLVELILSMVIISIALTGILSVMNLTVSHSADPIVEHQAIAIAESYLEEISLQAFADPNGTNAGETRATYDNVADYDGLINNGVRNQLDVSVSSLSSYNVSVAVVDQTVAGLTPKQITVTVSGPGVSGITLVGYKFNY